MWKRYNDDDRQRTNFDQKSSLESSSQMSSKQEHTGTELLQNDNITESPNKCVQT